MGLFGSAGSISRIRVGEIDGFVLGRVCSPRSAGWSRARSRSGKVTDLASGSARARRFFFTVHADRSRRLFSVQELWKHFHLGIGLSPSSPRPPCVLPCYYIMYRGRVYTWFLSDFSVSSSELGLVNSYCL